MKLAKPPIRTFFRNGIYLCENSSDFFFAQCYIKPSRRGSDTPLKEKKNQLLVCGSVPMCF